MTVIHTSEQTPTTPSEHKKKSKSHKHRHRRAGSGDSSATPLPTPSPTAVSFSEFIAPPSPLPVLFSDFIGPASPTSDEEVPKKERKHKEKKAKQKKEKDHKKEGRRHSEVSSLSVPSNTRQPGPSSLLMGIPVVMGIPLSFTEPPRLPTHWTAERSAMTSKYGFKKVRMEWELVLDGKYHRIRLYHALVSGKRELEVDSVVVETQKKVMDDGSVHVFHLSNPASNRIPVLCAAVIGLAGVQFTYELEVPMGTRFAAAKQHYLDGWYCGKQAWHEVDTGERTKA